MWPAAYDLSNNTCLIFNDTIATIATVRLGTALFGILLCIVAAIVIAFFKLYRKFTHRLYLYLTLSNILYSATFIIQYLAVDYEEKIVFHVPCMMAGFLMQLTGWVVLLFTTIITIHLSCLIIAHKNFNSKKVEVFYVLFGVGFPIIFCWIPFIHETYGLAGDWCWIRWANYVGANSTTVAIRCPLHLEGVIESIILWNAPMIILVVVSFSAAITMIAVLIRRSRIHSTYSDMQQKHIAVLRETLPFLIYPFFFYLICILEVINHIYYAVHFHDPSFGLWVVNAMCAPMRAIPIILALLCPGVFVKMKRNKDLARTLHPGQDANNETSFLAGSEQTSQIKNTSSINKISSFSYKSVPCSGLEENA